MRKTVIDGSNTSGFQRTILIAKNGYVETEKGKVGISSLYLEEDAARIISREKEKEVYRLDRLGIPLVEIVTAPEIYTPEQAKEVALKIGAVLRSCKVKRGIGTIRQDVNISIGKGNRVEIKGMQDMDIFVKAINNEILRHKKLLDDGKPVEMEVRNVLPDATSEFLRPLPGSSRMYPETDLPLLKISRDFINASKKTIPELKEIKEDELRSLGLSNEMISLLFKRNKLEEFKEFLNILNEPMLIAKILLVFPKEIASHKKITLGDVEEIIESNLFKILEFVKSNKIERENIKSIIEKIVSGTDLEKLIKQESSEVLDLEEKIMKLIKDKPGLNPNAYMGLIMKEFKGNISGKEAMGFINKFVKKT